MTNIWFSGRIDGEVWINFEPTPDRFTVTIAYDGPDGTPYKDTVSLDTDLLRGHTFVSSSAAPENQIKEIGKSLAKLEKSITGIARTVTAQEPSSHER